MVFNCKSLRKQKNVTMNNLIKSQVFFLAVFLSNLFSFQVATSQNYTLSNSSSSLEIHGTSSLHDWTIETEKQSGKLVISNTDNLEISSLNITVEAESLESGKSAMNKNTYKALNTDDYNTMTYSLTSVSNVTKNSDTSYKVTTTGKMTIAGKTKTISMDMTVTLSGTKVTLVGEKSFNMTDFGVEPPTAMFGTIKTGDAIKITFNSVFNK